VPPLRVVQIESRERRTEFLEHRHQVATPDGVTRAIVGKRQPSTRARELNVQRRIVGEHTGVDIH